jgi:AcrR family transcriptional regulator
VGHGGDPRVTRSKEAILAATISALGNEGLGAATIEGIAGRANVAKTTIYRHWPDRPALLLEAVERFSGRFEMPDTGDLGADLVAWLTFLDEHMTASEFGKALPAIVDGAEHDAEMGTALAQHSKERRALSLTRLQRAVERGELPPGTDCELVQLLVVSPIFYRRLVARTRLRPALIGRMVDHVLAGIPVGAEDRDG